MILASIFVTFFTQCAASRIKAAFAATKEMDSFNTGYQVPRPATPCQHPCLAAHGTTSAG
jgi:hypothetical protein